MNGRVIINQTAQQWGAYSYDSTKDVLRFGDQAGGNWTERSETFTIQFANAFVRTLRDLQLMWGKHHCFLFAFTTDVDARVMANIDEAMKGEKNLTILPPSITTIMTKT